MDTFKAAIVLLPLVAACGPQGQPLAAFASGSLSLGSDQGINLPPDQSADLTVVAQLLPGESCPTLTDDARALLNGMPMRLEAQGGPRQTADGNYCDSPSFSLHLPAAAPGAPSDGRLEISDGSGQVTVVVPLLLATRTLVPRQSLSTISRGEHLSFDWSPSEDHFFSQPQIFFNPVVNEYYDLAVAQAGSVIAAAVPYNVPSGATHLQTNMYPALTATECSGVSSCTATVTWIRGVATTVAP